MTKKTHTSGKPSMKWTRVDGAVKYQVQRSTNGGDFVVAITTGNLSYTNTGASLADTNVYKVRAVMADGSYGEFSNALTYP